MSENRTTDYAYHLTDRELDVLRLMGAGRSNQAIADQLTLSYNTVTWYVRQIFNKLGVDRRTQAVTSARALGILDEAREVETQVCTNALTRRELEVLTLAEAGLSNQAIADQLVLSCYTVAWHIRKIFKKLDVSSRTQAVAVAHSLGILGRAKTEGSSFRYQHNLPVQSTPFIGRESELAEIGSKLKGADCQLLTLLGPGGSGKTRLAIEAVEGLLDVFKHGVFFVHLAPLQDADKIPSTIARALNLSFSGQGTPEAQLLTYLRDKEMLLVLDNFEHLLEGVSFVNDILLVAPGIKILVTTRTSLMVMGEHIYPVWGMAYPEAPASVEATVSQYGAIKLFESGARRREPAFELTDENLPDVIRICALVEGMPLGIILAASWVMMLTPAEIATEIVKDLEFLETELRDLPPRQRSLRSVFNHSWRLLSKSERETMCALSVFRGSFTREAARAIAGASKSELMGLIDKTMLHRTLSGRYEVHELLRQYSEHHLNQSLDEAANIHDRHCAYYAELLARHRDNILSNQRVMMDALEPDLDNIRVAWEWSVAHARVDDILKSVHALAYFHVFRGRFLEEVEAFEAAIHNLDRKAPDSSNQLALAVLFSYLGWIYIRIGDSDVAEASFTRSSRLYQRVNEPPPAGIGTEPLTGLAMLACIRGDYDEAVRLGKMTCRLSQERGDPGNLKLGQYAIISAWFHQGRYEEARVLAEQTLKDSREAGGTWILADFLNALGNIARALGDYDQAMECYQESCEIRRSFNDPQGMAAALNFLGITATLEGDDLEASDYFQESYELYRQVGDRGGVGYALSGLGTLALATGDYEEARGYFHQALEIASDFQYIPVMFLALIGIAELRITTGRPARGIDILALVGHHEQCGHEIRERVDQILNRVSDDLSPGTYKAAVDRGKSLQLENMVGQLIVEGMKY